MTAKLRAQHVIIGRLDDATRQAMWELFASYYAEVMRAQFETDLDKKQAVILLRDMADGALRGFSTLETYQRVVAGRSVSVLFSGDTVIDRRYWGQTALHWAFLRAGLAYKMRHVWTPLYWFLITKGYKTYLLLARNFPEHWPRHERLTPPWQTQLIDVLAREKFGSAWQPDLGILRFEKCAGRLDHAVAPIDASLLRHADVRYFVTRNPGHAHGDELCCVGRIGIDLALHYGARVLCKTWRRVGERLALRDPG